MIFDSIVSNLATFGPTAGRELDSFDFTWTESRRRFLRRQTKAGRPVGLLLSVGVTLRHHDVCFADDRLLIVANLLPCRAIVIRPATIELAYELGQQHRPLEIRDDALILPDDDVLAAWLNRKSVPFTIELTRFTPLPTEFSLALPQMEIQNEPPEAREHRRRTVSV